MATDYISRQGLRERLGIDPDGDCEKCRYRGSFGCNQSNEHLRACEAIDDEPAADVRPVAEVDSLVDKATAVINDYYTAMPYEVYCKILCAVEDIYSMNHKKEDKHD